MTWPKFIVEELAERRCLLILGAGVSMSCVTEAGDRPPGWQELLTSLSGLLALEQRHAAEQEIAAGRYLEAAQIIAEGSIGEDRHREIKRLLERQFKPSRWLELCRDLDQNHLVTTNYDCILEDHLPRHGYRTHIHKDREAVKVIRSPERLIYKIHGCVRRDPGSMVLAGSDYHWLRAEAPHCLGLLEALFATHTGLFIGFSMADPDLRLVLENVRISFPHAQPHVVFTEDMHQPAVRRALEKSLNLTFVTYPRGKHDTGLGALEELYGRVESFRASR